mmetsp:Transcript_20789/g.67316  ORF Transcript_20789/g.67316 Transcript_20789/m.67316 type:complete len:221 (-) Transcript_20789:960-1622(-)|eukprot:scaffold14290_cov125-Isochrysis_galbana.AAC.7
MHHRHRQPLPQRLHFPRPRRRRYCDRHPVRREMPPPPGAFGRPPRAQAVPGQPPPLQRAQWPPPWPLLLPTPHLTGAPACAHCSAGRAGVAHPATLRANLPAPRTQHVAGAAAPSRVPVGARQRCASHCEKGAGDWCRRRPQRAMLRQRPQEDCASWTVRRTSAACSRLVQRLCEASGAACCKHRRRQSVAAPPPPPTDSARRRCSHVRRGAPGHRRWAN